MNLQIETVTTVNGKMDVIRDIAKVERLIDCASNLAARLRLWSLSGGETLCSEDAAALKEWDAISSNAGTQRPGSPDGSLATETRKPGSLK